MVNMSNRLGYIQFTNEYLKTVSIKRTALKRNVFSSNSRTFKPVIIASKEVIRNVSYLDSQGNSENERLIILSIKRGEN
jgi:hypothetical protein